MYEHVIIVTQLAMSCLIIQMFVSPEHLFMNKERGD